MSKIEVDAIDKQSGSTLTLGGSGTAVTLACGATQSGFGRSGSVNWQTTPKTATFTAANGEGYFINQGSAITANLPAGSAGAIVAFSDYARNFATYNLTISPNGSEKIGGIASNVSLNVNGQAATFVYVDSTKGWVNVQNAEDTEAGQTFIAATGGTVTCSGNFKIHTFTSPGTFTVCSVGNPAGLNSVDYMVVAGGGGGGGGSDRGGGGGAGGWRASSGTASGCYTAGPAPLTSPVSSLAVSAQGYPITVGGGGAGQPSGTPATPGDSGSNSVFSSITSAGGGGGAKVDTNGGSGGSGGGGGSGGSAIGCGGSGNTPSTTPAQGTNGGNGIGAPGGYSGGGGGGATAVGQNASSPKGGDGGAGSTSCISASPTAYAGGGGSGGGTGGQPGGAGGTGGGGAGANPSGTAVAGTTNTGGGGGGGAPTPSASTGSAAGGSGIVIIRYKFQ